MFEDCHGWKYISCKNFAFQVDILHTLLLETLISLAYGYIRGLRAIFCRRLNLKRQSFCLSGATDSTDSPTFMATGRVELWLVRTVHDTTQ